MQNTKTETHSIGRLLIALAFLGIAIFPLFYWFDQDHFSSADWHIHARFHMLWKTLLMIMGGGLGLWIIAQKWIPSTARSITRWVPVIIWTSHFVCSLIMAILFEENAFPHHDKKVMGLTVADIGIGLVLIIGTLGAILDRRAESLEKVAHS